MKATVAICCIRSEFIIVMFLHINVVTLMKTWLRLRDAVNYTKVILTFAWNNTELVHHELITGCV